jgi:hypothetical protein
MNLRDVTLLIAVLLVQFALNVAYFTQPESRKVLGYVILVLIIGNFLILFRLTCLRKIQVTPRAVIALSGAFALWWLTGCIILLLLTWAGIAKHGH